MRKKVIGYQLKENGKTVKVLQKWKIGSCIRR